MGTNFETIQETKDEMKKTAERMLDHVGELYQVIQNITKGYDPEKEIKAEPYYRGDFGARLTFNGMTEMIENGIGLLWEYRADINTLRGQGETDEPPEDRKSYEFLSENLNDER